MSCTLAQYFTLIGFSIVWRHTMWGTASLVHFQSSNRHEALLLWNVPRCTLCAQQKRIIEQWIPWSENRGPQFFHWHFLSVGIPWRKLTNDRTQKPKLRENRYRLKLHQVAYGPWLQALVEEFDVAKFVSSPPRCIIKVCEDHPWIHSACRTLEANPITAPAWLEVQQVAMPLPVATKFRTCELQQAIFDL